MTSEIHRLAAAYFLSVLTALGQTAVTVSGSRPLAKAAELLEHQYGVTVSYEDAEYMFKGDILDQTDPLYKQTHPDAKVFIPRGGPLSITMPRIAGSGASIDLQPVIQAVLDSHVRNAYPGEFNVIRTMLGYSIVPVRVRDATGAMGVNQSPLEKRVSFSSQRRTAKSTLNVLCDAVSNATGKKVVAGPAQGLENQVIQLGANNEPAREVLMRLITGRTWVDPQIVTPILRVSWALLYGPDVQTYALNLRVVVAKVGTPTGHVISRPVSQ